ncbi:MAG: hypothetical protein CSYNP_00357 [Syntrophus sp. SKADARSKE-3]|nr:hypothetical protein [Syntrophus sp. SKADARSKE-3]
MKVRQVMMVSLIAGMIILIAGIAHSQQGGDGKAEWKKVLKSEVAESVGDKGLINYQAGYIEALGIGAPPEKYYGKPQARPMALRAAQVDAYRNLVEIIHGVKIDSETMVKDFVVESDAIKAQASGLVKGAKTVKSQYLSDGTVEVVVRLRLSDVTRMVLPTVIINDEKKDVKDHEPIPFSPQPEPTGVVYTGLVIDARGLGTRAAVSPKVFDENGSEVYGTLIADKEIAAKQGLCGFSTDVEAAQRDQRVTNNPLTVKAIRAEGARMSELRISSEDARMIRSSKDNLGFLQKCRVMIVIEPRDEGCVPEGTGVTLADGSRKAIEGLKVNDVIVAYNVKEGKVAEARIEKILRHNSTKYVLHEVKTSGNHDLLVTGNHPVLTKADGWKEVDRLNPGDVIYIVNGQTRKMEETTIAAIIRDKGEKNVVYNLKTSQGNYLANDIVVHNKCLKSGAPIDTPSGIRPIETIAVGDMVWGQRDGIKTPVRVTNVYTKRTVLSSLPGKQLSPTVAVTDNHVIFSDGKFIPAARSSYPSTVIAGSVYDLRTEDGNYMSGGFLMKTGD